MRGAKTETKGRFPPDGGTQAEGSMAGPCVTCVRAAPADGGMRPTAVSARFDEDTAGAEEVAPGIGMTY